jgi:hypothetical protein
MDAAPAAATGATASERDAPAALWSGDACAHDLALVLSLVLPLLPLDARACAASVRRAWRAASAAPELWTELDFSRCADARAYAVDDTVLAALCVRAGAALRTLRLEGRACAGVVGATVLAALRDGGCAGVRHLFLDANPDRSMVLTAHLAVQLAAACPLLQHAACGVLCAGVEQAEEAAAALPGPLTLCTFLGAATWT